MNVLLSHVSLEPLFYGVLLAAGVFSILSKLLRGQFFVLAVEVITFFVVFSMHKGTLTGGLSAAICALIVGLLIKPFLRIFK